MLSLSDRHKIFASVYQLKFFKNAVFSKKNQNHYDNNKQKNLKSIKSEFRAI